MLPWATKGYWSYGVAGGLLAPITVGMARARYEGLAGWDIPLKIAEWYLANYPNYWSGGW